MKIKKLEIKNYRNIRSASIDFENLTIFIGKNDVGKSNILKAIDLFFNFESSNDVKEISAGFGGNNFNARVPIRDFRIFIDHNPKSKIEMIGTIELGDELKELFPEFPKYKIDINGISFGLEDLGREIKISKDIITDGKTATFKLKSITINKRIIYDSSSDQHLIRYSEGKYGLNSLDSIRRLHASKNKVLSELVLSLIKGSFVFIPAIRVIGEENRALGKASTDGKLVPNEFFRFEKDESLSKGEVFRRIQDNFKSIFPQYKNVVAKQHGEDKRDVYFGAFSSASVGVGVNQQFNNVFHIESNENKIFGIEEPEIHLHPEMQRKVFKFLKEKSYKKQIIMTTHSPIFIDSPNKNKIYIVKKKENDANIINLGDRKQYSLIKKELGIKNSDLLSYNSVIIVEGETESRAFNNLASLMNYDLGGLGIKIINISGKDKLGRMKEFLDYLEHFDVTPFLILDKDEIAERTTEDLIKSNLLEKDNIFFWRKGSFEDCFSDEQIIDAAIRTYGDKLDLDVNELNKLRKSKNVTNILSKYLYEKNLGDLNKPKFGENLVEVVGSEIKNGDNKRNKTEPELTIEKIVKSHG